jgi:hypothetical protein
MLALLHTSRTHVETFDRLARTLDHTIPIHHEVQEGLLAAARETGASSEPVRSAIARAVQALALEGAKVIVCTCSTIGAVAEQTPVPRPVRVLRIDRPMAERAVASGRRIVVAAALRSTLEPTTNLLHQIAASTGRPVDTLEVVCEGAWPLFEAGHRSGYVRVLARAIESAACSTDVILLAQASMAPVADLLDHLGAPILSSPKTGLDAAMSAYRTLAAESGAT